MRKLAGVCLAKKVDRLLEHPLDLHVVGGLLELLLPEDQVSCENLGQVLPVHLVLLNFFLEELHLHRDAVLERECYLISLKAYLVLQNAGLKGLHQLPDGKFLLLMKRPIELHP